MQLQWDQFLHNMDNAARMLIENIFAKFPEFAIWSHTLVY